MTKKKLSLIFAVSLTAVNSVYSISSYRYIDRVTGRIVNTFGFIQEQQSKIERTASLISNSLVPVADSVTLRSIESIPHIPATGAIAAFSGIELFSGIVGVDTKTERSFFDGAYAMVGNGIAAGATIFESLQDSQDAEQSVQSLIEQPVVIEQPSISSASTTLTVGNFIAEHPYMAYSIAIVVVGTVRNIWNVCKAKSKIAEDAKQNTITEVVPAVVVNIIEEISVTPVVTEALRITETLKPVVAPKQLTPAPVVKPAVNDIVRNNAENPSEMIKVLKAHGYTRAHVSEETLKQLGKLNDGQVKFVSRDLSKKLK